MVWFVYIAGDTDSKQETNKQRQVNVHASGEGKKGGEGSTMQMKNGMNKKKKRKGRRCSGEERGRQTDR